MADKMIFPRSELDDEALEKALKSDFKADEQPENLSKRMKNLVQYSDKKISRKTKGKMLANLRPQTSALEEEVQVEEVEEVEKNDKKKKKYIVFPPSVRNPGMIRNCLTLDEQRYFLDRWKAYYKEYGDNLNEANDYDQMVELMMCLIDLYRIQKRKFTKQVLIEDSDLDQITHRIHGRIQAILSSLNTRRKDRMQINQHSESNLIDLLMQKNRQLRDGNNEQIKNEEEEEANALRAKISRGS